MLHGQALPRMIRILPDGPEIVFVLQMRFINLFAVPHWPEKCSVAEDLDFMGVCSGDFLRSETVKLVDPWKQGRMGKNIATG